MAMRQRHAVGPARAEIEPAMPELGRCELRRVMIASQPRGTLEEHEVVVAEESGLTFMFVRSLKKAIYGEVWSALQVTLHGRSESGSGVDFYRVVLDDNGNQRRLAVKRMPWDIINKQLGTVRENPLNEIAFLTRMQDPGHPNVVGLAEALEDGSTVYLTTPFVGGVGGGEMFDWVADNYLNPATEDVIRPLLHQMIDGMRYMHSKGICHADMSLENTLINVERTKAFIIDFGMALQMPTDAEGRRCKSVPDGRKAKRSYCAPETYKGKEYDGVKVDVFSVGCMAFMMFTGIPPFDAATRFDPKFRKVVFRGDLQGYLRDYRIRPLPNPDTHNLRDYRIPPLPDPVFRLVKSMMAYKPEDRPLPEELLQDPWFATIAAVDEPAAAPKEVPGQGREVVSVQRSQGAAPPDDDDDDDDEAAAAGAPAGASARSTMHA